MDALFRCLPEALQWEILTDFVGGYAVRFNRLRRRLTNDMKIKIQREFDKTFVMPLRQISQLVMLDYNNRNYLHFRAVTCVRLSDGQATVVLYKNISTNEYVHGIFVNEWKYISIEDSVSLQAYEKHTYPSYPYTNKKLGRSVQKIFAGYELEKISLPKIRRMLEVELYMTLMLFRIIFQELGKLGMDLLVG